MIDANHAAAGLTPFPEKGKPKGSRIKDAQSVLNIYGKLRKDDQESARLRAGVQAMFDGEPPWKQAALRASGAGFRHNLNFGKGKAILSQTLAGYNDLIENVDTLASVEIPYGIGDPVAASNWEDVIDEEFTRMIRDWTDFDKRWQLLSKEFVAHGVAFGFFEDEFTWKFQAAGWDDMKVPRGTRASEDYIEILMADKAYLPHEIYNFIKDEAVAKEMGWNVELVKEALVYSTMYSGSRRPNQWGSDWALLQRKLKNNDLSATYEYSVSVETIQTWVREYDGSYSFYVSLKNPCGEADDFLYKRESRYSNSENAFTTFCYDVGNGFYHGIRGLGYNIFPYVQSDNRMRCDVLDSTSLSSKIAFQPKDSNGMDQAPYTVNGPVILVSPQWEIMKQTFPNLSQNVLPIIHDFSIQMDANSPSPQSRQGSDRQARTAYELKAEQNTDSALTISAQTTFYRSWRRLLREMFRRVQQIIEIGSFDDYPEVQDFVTACANREVPVQAILAIKRVNEVRAVGMGSPANRQRIYDEAFQMVSMFDEVGRKALARSKLVSLLGACEAARIMPADPKPRPVIDQTVALLENSLMFGGKEIPPLDGQNHFVHAQVHMQAIAESIQKLEDWRNSGEQGSIEQLQPDISFLAVILPHTEQHVAALGYDQTRQGEFASLRKALQNYTAMWMTYMRQLKKVLDERAQEQAANPQPQMDPEMAMKFDEHKAKMQMAQDKFAMEQTMKVRDVMNQMELDRRQTDEKIAAKIREGTVDQALNAGVDPSYLDGELAGARASNILTNARYHV